MPLRALGAALVAALVALALPATARAEGPPCVRLGEDVAIATGETLDCSLVVVGGDVVVAEGGAIAGDLAVPFGHATIDGAVEGDAYASAGVRLGGAARVEGDVSSLGAVERDAGARVAGLVRDRDVGPAPPPPVWVDPARAVRATAFLAVVALLTAGAALVGARLLPLPVLGAAQAAQRTPARALGALIAGFAAWLAVLALVVLSAPTLFLPLSLGLGLSLVWATGGVAMAETVGRRFLPTISRTSAAAAGAGGLAAAAMLPFLVPRWWAFAFGAALSTLLGALAVGSGLVGWVLGGRAMVGAGPNGAARFQRPVGTRRDAASTPSDGVSAHDGGDHSGLEVGRDPTDAAGPGRPRDRGPHDVWAAAADAAATGADAPAPAPPWGHAPAPAPPSDHAPAPAPDPPAALRDLPGMTPIYAQLLATAGFGALADVARADPAALVQALSVPGVRPVAIDVAGIWVARARRAAADAP